MQKTYDEWKALGRQVRLGEESTIRSAQTGKPLFTAEQTDPYTPRRKRDTWASIGEHPEEDFDAMDIPY